MNDFTPKERAHNFTNDEKERFRYLIDKYKEVLFNKRTDNTSNLKKHKIWAAIHAEFNANGHQLRTLRQLKLKFDNMKRNARKDASQERQYRIRTGGGPPPSIQQDPETEWFRTVMPISMDGLPSVADDDSQNDNINKPAVIPVVEICENQETNISKETITLDAHEIEDLVFDTKSPAALIRTPVSKPLRVHRRFQRQNDYRALKTDIITKLDQYEKHIYELKIKHMEEVRTEEKQIHKLKIKNMNDEETINNLKKKKLELEIILLNKKINDEN